MQANIPALRLISRLTVDGDLTIVRAIALIDRADANPLEIFPRSSRERYKLLRFRCTSDIPPFNLSTPNIEPACRSTVKPISLKV